MKAYQSTIVGVIGLVVSQSIAGATIISLGTASTFGVLGASAVTSTGPSIVNGDVGVSPLTSITGFPPGTIIGIIHSNDVAANLAQADAQQAYNDLGGLAVTTNLTGLDLGGRTLTTGVYNFDSAAALTGNLTLSGPGSFVFLIGTTLTTGAASMVSLSGADASNVFFRVGSSATLGSSSTFVGTIIANTSVTATTGANLQGRLIALNGAVTLDSNNIIAVPETSGAALLGLGALGLLARRKRC